MPKSFTGRGLRIRLKPFKKWTLWSLSFQMDLRS
jgi:hypothetical protein